MSYIGNDNITQGFIPAVDFFSGNGSTTAFTLSRPVASVAQVEVYVSNVPQTPNTAYSVSGNTITFTSAPPSGTNNIYVYYTSPITQVIAPGQGTVTSSSFGTITDFTTTGNTILGDASTDTLNVGNGGLVKDASGNVGIGTASPTYKLDVAQTSGDVVARVFANATTTSSRLEITNGDGTTAINYSYIRFINNKTSSQDWRFGTYGNNNLSFVNLTAGTTPMTLDSSGNLLVGTTSVDGNGGLSIKPSASVGATQLSWNRATSTSSTTAQVFYNAGTSVGGITYNNTTTSFVTSSDYRLKENIAPMSGALDKVSQLNPVTYNWKSDGSSSEGFIAHELAEVVPQCVVGEKDAVDADGNPIYQGIDTSFLVATLTAAIKEQQALIQTLTDRITALENK